MYDRALLDFVKLQNLSHVFVIFVFKNFLNMKLYIAPCSPIYKRWEKSIRKLEALASDKIHAFVESPDEADIILVPEPQFMYDHQWSFLHRYLGKCFAFGTLTTTHYLIPGLYTNAPQSWWQKYRFRGCSYFLDIELRNAFVGSPDDTNSEKKYLFSFVGSSTSWVRKRLLKLKLQQSDILLCSTNNYNHWGENQPDRNSMQKSYVDTIRDSKFALCPRGAGWGSIRLFEVMELGVAPIIISDRWLPPIGPDWNNYTLFVKQSELNNLVKIVEDRAWEYEERGRLARKAWQEYFSEPVIFNRSIEAIVDLKNNRIAILDRAIFYSYPLILAIIRLKQSIYTSSKFVILKLTKLFKIQFPYELRG